MIEGVRVGHVTDLVGLTGCTVIIPPPGTKGSVSIPGNAPASRETDVIGPGRRVDEPSAILLTGGSAFGLAAADGVMRWCEEQGLGHWTPWARVPIVPTAGIFDLGIGDASRRPTAGDGYAACVAAREGPVAEGNVGAGTGATVGKGAGPAFISKGGVGCSTSTDGALAVSTIAVVNAVGDVVDDDGSIIAGARSTQPWEPPVEPNTTIACVVTNAALTKDGCFEVARAAEAGLARAIRPVHTLYDGDTVFALATGVVEADAQAVGSLAAEALADAVRRAVRAATDVPGAPALGRPSSPDTGVGS